MARPLAQDAIRGVMRRVAVVASASGNGKTTLGRQLADALGVQFVELDALVHGPAWAETPDDVLRAQLGPILASDGWVIDGTYQHKIGDLVPRSADTVVWLDLPIRVWFPRLVRRSWRHYRGHERLWNDNKESLTSLVFARDSLFVWAFRSHFRRRREWPEGLRASRVVRLRTPAEVERLVADVRVNQGQGATAGAGVPPPRSDER
jgi:adenylate kinase family enzyme